MSEMNTKLTTKEAKKMPKKRRVYQIAKELNLSHEEIINFLDSNKISVKSHMSPIDNETYLKILDEFAKEKVLVDRQRQEKLQREAGSLDSEASSEIHTDEVEAVPEIIPPHKVVREIVKKEDIEIEQKPDEKEDAEPIKKDVTQTELLEPVEPISVPEEETSDSDIEDQPDKEIIDDMDSPSQDDITVAEKPELAEKGEVRKEPPTVDKKRKKVRKRVRIKKTKDGIEKSNGFEGMVRGRRKRRRAPSVDEKQVAESIKKTLADLDGGKTKKRKKRISAEDEIEIETNVLKIPEFISVGDLAHMMDVPPNDVITKCMTLGYMVTINQRIDFDTIVLLADEFGFKVEKEEEYGAELLAESESEEDEDLESHAPVVTVMGHVDHGKTSLLDYIRDANVVAGEAGGITQHMGAYRVIVRDSQPITFIDTPGHEAFTAMRARGAQVTDIVVLVVAADDGVQPQTIEAINHAKAAGVPIIVAINKIDKKSSNPDNVKRELSEHRVVVEEWGGKVQCSHISAKTGEGIDNLLELVLLEAEVLELKANPNSAARGIVVEAKLDKGLGPIGTILIQKGTLRKGEAFICGPHSGKVRALLNERGQKIESASPSMPVQVLGFSEVPSPSDYFAVLKDEREVKRISQERQRLKREKGHRRKSLRSLDEISRQILDGKVKELSIIIKGDTNGSVEALADTISKLSTKEVAVKIIHRGVGTVTESDILLASASEAVVLGFHVNASEESKKIASIEKVDIRIYDVIYNAVEEIRMALEGMLEPEKIVNVIGTVEVRQLFKISRYGLIAGCYVTSGKVSRGDNGRLIRNDEMIAEVTVDTLKRFKDDAKEVSEGFECGIMFDGIDKVQEGDIIEIYEILSKKRTLEDS